jgi:integrase
MMAVLTEMTKTGAARYKVRYRVNGRQKEKTFLKHRAAVDFDNKTKTQLRDGNYAEPSNFTVKEIVEKWLAARKPRWKTQTYLGHKTHLDKYIGSAFGNIKATSLKGPTIENAGTEWQKSISAKTVAKIYASLNAAYKYARKLDVRQNPMVDVERPVDAPTPEQFEAEASGMVPDRSGDDDDARGRLRSIRPDEVFSAIELKKIIEASTPGLERAKHMTAIFTGLRHGELNALLKPVPGKSNGLNLKSGTLFVNRSLTQLKGGPVLEKPKTRAAYRRLKLPPELVAELRRWVLQVPKSPNGFLFCDEDGGPMTRKINNVALKACCQRAGVRALSMNNLRHSFASQHLIAGTRVLEVSKLMGHSTPDVTLRVYARWAEREESTAELALAERIFGAEDRQESTGTE